MVEVVRMLPFLMAILFLALRRSPKVTLGLSTSVQWTSVRVLWLAKRAHLPVRAV